MVCKKTRSMISRTVGSPLALALLLAVALAPGCGDDNADVADAAGNDGANPGIDAADPPQYDAATPDAAGPAFCTPQAGAELVFQEVANGFTRPLFVTSPANDPRLFVVEQPGRIYIVEDGTRLEPPFLDIRAVVRDSGNEQGLLGLAFHPNYAQNGLFYVNYTAANPSGDTVVAEYQVSADPNVADDLSERRLMVLDQPAGNHNGGMVVFGPDGYLYIGTGDGGGGGDPYGNGQDFNTLLAAILRIDVDNGDPYGIPNDNPYVGVDGADEVWAWGLRNPWRFSFDRQTGDLYIGDVGQNTWEEVDVQLANSTGGENYGWNVYEGSSCFAGPCNDPSPYTMPVWEENHNTGVCSITGGYVYRGTCLPDIQGHYFFSDYCNGIWSFRHENGNAVDVVDRTNSLDPGGIFGNQFTSWGQDAYGEIYGIARGGGIYRLSAQ